MRDTELITALRDAGCTKQQAEEIGHLYAQGAEENVLRKLKCCRCAQLGAVHEEQRKIDLYDYVIDLVKKEFETDGKPAE